MKTYKETKQAVKELILEVGIENILTMHIAPLYDEGHSVANVQSAMNYFRYSPQAKKYR